MWRVGGCSFCYKLGSSAIVAEVKEVKVIVDRRKEQRDQARRSKKDLIFARNKTSQPDKDTSELYRVLVVGTNDKYQLVYVCTIIHHAS